MKPLNATTRKTPRHGEEGGRRLQGSVSSVGSLAGDRISHWMGPGAGAAHGPYLRERVTVGNVCILYNACIDSTSVIRKRKRRGKTSPKGQFLRPALKTVCVAWTEVQCCDVLGGCFKTTTFRKAFCPSENRSASRGAPPRTPTRRPGPPSCGRGVGAPAPLSACPQGPSCFPKPRGCDLGRAPCAHTSRAVPSRHIQET